LPRLPLKGIRWPGDEGLDTRNPWPKRGEYSAIVVRIHQETALKVAEVYRESTAVSSAAGVGPLDADLVVAPNRAIFARILVQEWARALHGDRIALFVSSEAHLRGRVRSYKGNLDKRCRHGCISFRQGEFGVAGQSTVILNEAIVGSDGLNFCFDQLGDTFRSFGAYEGSSELHPDERLGQVFSCFEMQRGIWTWDAARLIPTICDGTSSFFFLQGLASATTIELVAYLPVADVESHLNVARSRFGATLENGL